MGLSSYAGLAGLAGIANLVGLSNYMIARGEFLFRRLHMHRPQDLFIAYFLVQDAEADENHAHKKTYVIKIVM